MALMYDMETVNKAMQTAASFVASGGTEREKYIARDCLSSTTFGELGFSKASMPSSSAKGFTNVAISVFSSSKHSIMALNCDSAMKGSSPCTFITTSYSSPTF